jgi:hypothetical protein
MSKFIFEFECEPVQIADVMRDAWLCLITSAAYRISDGPLLWADRHEGDTVRAASAKPDGGWIDSWVTVPRIGLPKRLLWSIRRAESET